MQRSNAHRRTSYTRYYTKQAAAAKTVVASMYKSLEILLRSPFFGSRRRRDIKSTPSRRREPCTIDTNNQTNSYGLTIAGLLARWLIARSVAFTSRLPPFSTFRHPQHSKPTPFPKGALCYGIICFPPQLNVGISQTNHPAIGAQQILRNF